MVGGGVQTKRSADKYQLNCVAGNAERSTYRDHAGLGSAISSFERSLTLILNTSQARPNDDASST